MTVSVVTEPTTSPVSVLEMKRHLRVTHDDEDELIEACIEAATKTVERKTRRQLITATFDAVFERWENPIRIYPAPLASVTGVYYLDEDGAEQEYASASYEVRTDKEPGEIWLAYDAEKPLVRQRHNTLRVRFVAGYATAAAVPRDLAAAVKLFAAQLYEYREPILVNEIPHRLPYQLEMLVRGRSLPEVG